MHNADDKSVTQRRVFCAQATGVNRPGMKQASMEDLVHWELSRETEVL
jgi:hypothetical protein